MNIISSRKRALLIFTHSLLLAVSGFIASVRADVKLPAIFSDYMVLQSGVAVPVWGWADPGEEVTVSFDRQNKKTKAGADGKWQVKLAKLKAGASGTLMVQGRNRLVVRDILAGEVWLCSGQSNMAMPVDRSENADQEKTAANFPQIRMFTVARNPQTEPQSDCQGLWVICSPGNVGAFSAAAYFFGRELHQKVGGPVGLINSSYGGTPVEAWTSMSAQARLPEYEIISAPWTAKNIKPNRNKNYPANLFNGMIAPIIPYAIRGAIWYQGENNAGQPFAHLYGLQLTTMIKDWRQRWGHDFPFAWVQLPEFRAAKPAGWVAVQEQMLKTLKVPKTGMAIALGLGEAKDIHPKKKQEVGHRLALWARAEVYHQKGFAFSGPLPAGHRVKGNEIIVTFKHADGGLVAKGEKLKGFLIAGADQKWVPANARIEGNKVILSHPEVSQPAAARYAWADYPEFNLYNGAGLPATPFRTDNWK